MIIRHVVRLSTLALLLFTSFIVYAGQPVVWETSARADLLKGDARGVSISDNGVLMLSPKLTELFNTQQTYVWSTAVDSAGNVFVGTGPVSYTHLTLPT